MQKYLKTILEILSKDDEKSKKFFNNSKNLTEELQRRVDSFLFVDREIARVY